jgi:hypothetical protein
MEAKQAEQQAAQAAQPKSAGKPELKQVM